MLRRSVTWQVNVLRRASQPGAKRVNLNRRCFPLVPDDGRGDCRVKNRASNSEGVRLAGWHPVHARLTNTLSAGDLLWGHALVLEPHDLIRLPASGWRTASVAASGLGADGHTPALSIVRPSPSCPCRRRRGVPPSGNRDPHTDAYRWFHRISN
jgi:hypothetical protein